MSHIDFKQPYDRADFLTFVGQNFLPEDFRLEVENIDFSSNYTKQATRLGTCESLGLEVIELKHTSTHDARVGLSKEAFRMLLNRSTHNRALIIFVSQDKPSTYRFSLVIIEVSVNEHKVRRAYSNPRRYSFVLGEEAKVRTPQEYLVHKGRVKNLEDLQKRFSVEVLTKEFYAELSDWYSWAISEVKFPNAPMDATKEQQIEHNSKNVIRLLTRLLFVWFLKQKDLIPNELFDPKYLGDYILDDFDPIQKIGLFEDKGISNTYYKAILQNLFFATLNCPISSENKMSRGFRTEGQHFDINSLMRYEKLFKEPKLFLELVNSKVPFLNGGLFDCLDDKPNKIYIDGFSDNLIAPHKLIVPDYLFFGEEKGKSIDLTWFYGGDKKKKNVNVRGLIDILNTYNFTIEENTPYDQEVSLDPELLGKVFENLLASYNPETKTTARKQTGSFYTPREIVQYMVDESLITHLKRTVGEDLESEYRKLMQYTDEELQLTTAQKQEIIRSLNNCKIIDPACGSGAFPVGILQQMVHMLSQLDPDNVYWHQIVKESTLGEMSKALDIQDEEAMKDIIRSFNKDINRPDYARKLYLIENCIYGVDIQSIAVQISKLRFFISLVVEQKKTEDANDNFGIRPLPNLEAKFVAANTLIGIEKKKIGDFVGSLFDNQDIKKKEEELKLVTHKIYGAKTSNTKKKYKDILGRLRMEIADMLVEIGAVGNDAARQLAQWDMFDQNASSPFFDSEWMFGVSDGFDVVIGNPPYIDIKSLPKKDVKEYFKIYNSCQNRINLYSIFIDKGVSLLNANGNLTFINPNSLLINESYKKLRIQLINYIEMIIKLPNVIFDKAFVETIIIQFVNQREINPLIKGKVFENNEYFNLSSIKFSTFERSRWKSDKDCRYDIFGNEAILSLMNKIEEKSISLIELADFSLGITPYDKYKGHSQTDIKNRIFHSKVKRNNDFKPLITGSNITQYKIFEEIQEYIHYGKWLGAPREQRFFIDPRIIVRQIISANPLRIFAGYTEKELYYTQIGFGVIPKSNLTPKFLLSLINSSLINFYHKYKFLDTEKNVFQKILIANCKLLPIKIPDNQQPFIGLVDKIMIMKESNHEVDISEIEADLNKMIYQLYDLSADEIKIIEG